MRRLTWTVVIFILVAVVFYSLVGGIFFGEAVGLVEQMRVAQDAAYSEVLSNR